jgi:hypothetical protein
VNGFFIFRDEVSSRQAPSGLVAYPATYKPKKGNTGTGYETTRQAVLAAYGGACAPIWIVLGAIGFYSFRPENIVSSQDSCVFVLMKITLNSKETSSFSSS